MDLQQFRINAHRVADWMADYLVSLPDRPVSPSLAPGAIRRQFPAAPPSTGESFEQVLADLERIVMPGMSHWQHPGWFGYFPADTSPASVLAEMMTATMGANCMSWATCPAGTETEQAMMEWLRQLIGLPATFTGVIQDTASSATLVAILCARERATGFSWSRLGASAPDAGRLTVYASREAHSSIAKGVRLAGIGEERLRLIDTDATFAMRPDALASAMAADVAAGLKPACVVATVGTTSSTALDPVPAIAELTARYGAWLHVDAAYAGSAAVLPEQHHLLQGVDRADSFVFNPHKWLFTNFDCSAYFVRDVDTLVRTCGIHPEYLKSAHDDAVVNYRDWGIPLGRRFRALKLWFVLRDFGVEGLQAKIREHIALAREFRGWVEADPAFEPMAPTPLGLVCFRHRPTELRADDPAVDELNRRLLASINSTGRALLTHTTLNGRYVLRLSVGSLALTREYLRETWELIVECAAGV
ncbi:MAG TPA: pyridoxal-dependent decarboxylase [Gemmatimonadales bacterium]|nr:pyridoxal-dependent decarboxylase [Gemmatimonadales bacterium]